MCDQRILIHKEVGLMLGSLERVCSLALLGKMKMPQHLSKYFQNQSFCEAIPAHLLHEH